MDRFSSSKIIIAHRANLQGPSPKTENTISSIYKCFDAGFNVEIDVWWKNGSFWLGHDNPSYPLASDRILTDPKVWAHAKNLEAAINLEKIEAHWFWHQNDDFTLTSKGYFWTYPGKTICQKSIAVLPEINFHETTFSLAIGICTDFPFRYIA